jgi:hypothetical protein
MTSNLTPDHLPWFITAPGETDGLYVVTTLIVLTMVILLGVFFFRLHSLPEQLGHKKLQWEIVAVLALISLFTHQHVFWIIALILALIDFPDFWTPLHRMARALERMTGGPVTPEEPAVVQAASPPPAVPLPPETPTAQKIQSDA